MELLAHKTNAINQGLEKIRSSPIFKPLSEFESNEERKERTLKQNRFYFGYAIPVIQNGFVDVGYKRHEVTVKDVHKFLKKHFCPRRERYNDITNKIEISIPSTADLDTKEFNEYILYIQIFGAEFLRVYVPDPNEIVNK